MSVTVDKRDEGKFSLATKAEYLARYTIEITSNENVFFPEYRKQVTDDIVEHLPRHPGGERCYRSRGNCIPDERLYGSQSASEGGLA